MLYFILPAYNEECNIAPQLNSIRELAVRKNYEYRVIIVNDGSKDKTREEAQRLTKDMPITLIDHPTNKGVAEAFRTGFAEVRKYLREEDVVVTMDADNTQNLKSIELMVSKIQEGYEVVSGSIFASGGMLIGAPFVRYILTCGCNMLYKMLFYVKGIYEYTGFYRAHSGRALKVAFEKFSDKLIETSGFAVMAEMLIKFRQIPLFITEVPMIIRYDLKGGASKLKIVPTIIQHLTIIGKNMFKRRII